MARSILLFVTGVIMLWAAANIMDPYLVPARPWGGAVIIGITLLSLGAVWHSKSRWWKTRWLLVGLWCSVPVTLAVALGVFHLRKQSVLAATGPEVQALGRHFVVGYNNVDDIEALASKGLIGGIFVTSRNATGKTKAELRAEIDRLQAVRDRHGLPPLIVATDQEGGIVARLSPPLPETMPLATIADASADQRADKAHSYGVSQGQDLASVGVTVNLAPVLDLRPQALLLDRNSHIEERAISADPQVVAEIGLAYVRGLQEAGIAPTLKHFPGLGRVMADTHHFRTSVPTTRAELEAADWVPFRKVLSETTALLMIGHVTLSAIDPDRPASYSHALIDGILRKEWGYQGVIITDDMVMSPIYQYDLCGAVTGGLNSGVDLLLVAFDQQQFYRTMRCALDAHVRGQLDASQLATSDKRLEALVRRSVPLVHGSN